MALWGKTDALVSMPKFVARKASFDSATAVNTTTKTINLLASNTGFATGDAVAYSINGGTVITGLVDGTTYFARVVGAGLIELYDTYARAIDTGATTGRKNLTGAGVGVQTLQRTGAANPAGDHVYNGKTILFVDREEAQQAGNRAKGLKSPGWYAYSTYTDVDSSVRQKAELLVAIDVVVATSGDAADDAVVQDPITISVQPASASVTAPDTATFTVTAVASPATLAYQWQKAESTAPTVWANVGTNSNSYTTGVTAVAAGAGATNGDLYRVVISATGVASVTSNTATLTVTA